MYFLLYDNAIVIIGPGIVRNRVIREDEAVAGNCSNTGKRTREVLVRDLDCAGRNNNVLGQLPFDPDPFPRLWTGLIFRTLSENQAVPHQGGAPAVLDPDGVDTRGGMAVHHVEHGLAALSYVQDKAVGVVHEKALGQGNAFGFAFDENAVD